AARAARLESATASYDEATLRAARVLRAQALAERVRALEPDRSRCRESARATRAVQERAAGLRDARRRERDGAGEARARPARGLADLQVGLEELHRSVQAHRQAVRRLNEARDALAEPTLDESTVAGALERSRLALPGVDDRPLRPARRLESPKSPR